MNSPGQVTMGKLQAIASKDVFPPDPVKVSKNIYEITLYIRKFRYSRIF